MGAGDFPGTGVPRTCCTDGREEEGRDCGVSRTEGARPAEAGRGQRRRTDVLIFDNQFCSFSQMDETELADIDL